MAKAESTAIEGVEVKFGKVSWGDKTCSVGFTIAPGNLHNRRDLALTRMYEVFCQTEVDVTVHLDKDLLDELDGVDGEVSFTARTSGIAVNRKKFSANLSMTTDAVRSISEAIDCLAMSSGTIDVIVNGVAEPRKPGRPRKGKDMIPGDEREAA